ncbi:MAG TPA: glycoside hydrolase family 2 protein [Candidatus Dormibacteraeota bacterium]|nr:glycoside hydrolase family 2 protein [Candidatus Dormibacteraeota bacterium]
MLPKFPTFPAALALVCAPAVLSAQTQPADFALDSNWRLQSSCEIKSTGQQISTVGFPANSWHAAVVPGTVVGSLVTDKTYKDPFFATNLKSLPGMNYSTEPGKDFAFFALQDMPKGSPFLCSWWYRTEFSLPAEFNSETRWLHFLGINYRANIWLNGTLVANEHDVAGPHRMFEFNVSKLLHPGKNALAVEVFAPQKDDPALTWVDWAPTPADKDMGIWREVFLSRTSDVAVRNAFVSSKLDSEYKTAALTVSVDLRNAADHDVSGVLQFEFDSAKISQPVTIPANQLKTARFTPDQFKELQLAHPKFWWPYQVGEPYLYTAKISFRVGGKSSGDTVSDSSTVTFGVREVTSQLTDQGNRLFKINGRNILIRGAAWAPDLFLRWSSPRLDADLAYVKDMNMNTIRLEGRMDREEFFDKTDRLGILVMPGWTCCDSWERWDVWTPETRNIAAASMTDQANRLRNHPSVFVFLYGSDGPPPADIETMYLNILKAREWPNPSVSSASAETTKVTGKSGVKMTGPYEYVPPVYWLTDKEAGGAHGYNTETSPGPAIPTIESLKKFIPADHLWPIDDVWNYHAGLERFTTINVFLQALNERYGTATSLEDFERKSQAATYDGQRAMFEAYGRNKYTSTGVIQWMLNNGWPSLIWHLYDYYLVPAGGYFGTKKANEIVHVQYSYDDNSVAVVNGRYEPIKNVKVTAKIYDINAKEKAAKDATIDLPSDGSVKAFDLPTPENLSTTYFLKLQLHDATGKLISDNFYWLSRKPDTLDWKNKQDTVYTPQAQFGDLKGLNSLPQIKLQISASAKTTQNTGVVSVSIKNQTQSLAFMVHPRLAHGSNLDDVTPIFWEDNYFSLLPGEQRTVTATYNLQSLNGEKVSLVVDGFNVAPVPVPVAH